LLVSSTPAGNTITLLPIRDMFFILLLNCQAFAGQFSRGLNLFDLKVNV